MGFCRPRKLRLKKNLNHRVLHGCSCRVVQQGRAVPLYLNGPWRRPTQSQHPRKKRKKKSETTFFFYNLSALFCPLNPERTNERTIQQTKRKEKWELNVIRTFRNDPRCMCNSRKRTVTRIHGLLFHVHPSDLNAHRVSSTTSTTTYKIIIWSLSLRSGLVPGHATHGRFPMRLIVISHLYTVSRLLNRIKVFGIYNKFRRGREDEGGGNISQSESRSSEAIARPPPL